MHIRNEVNNISKRKGLGGNSNELEGRTTGRWRVGPPFCQTSLATSTPLAQFNFTCKFILKTVGIISEIKKKNPSPGRSSGTVSPQCSGQLPRQVSLPDKSASPRQVEVSFPN